jgi:hypothetical protein
VVTLDSAGNKAVSSNKITVTSKSKEEALNLVLGELRQLFGPIF